MKKINIKNILVPIDFSPLSGRAIEVAQHLAQPFSATVHLVHVHEYHPMFDYMKPAAPIPTPLKAFRETAGQHIANDLEKLAKKYGVSGANCYIQEGASIFNEVCNVAGTINADLIVISTHGRTGLKHVVLGSTAERIVQHSPFPVLVVPSHPEVRVGQLTKARRVAENRAIDRRPLMVNMVRSGCDPPPLITHRFKLGQIVEAFKFLRQGADSRSRLAFYHSLRAGDARASRITQMVRALARGRGERSRCLSSATSTAEHPTGKAWHSQPADQVLAQLGSAMARTFRCGSGEAPCCAGPE